MLMARLKSLYNDKLKHQIKEELGLANVMQVPKITKITLNMGVGGASQDKKLLEGAVADMTAIAGQKPVVTKARKSVAGFKIREEWPIGCKVTLRGEQMYEFLDRLIGMQFLVFVISAVFHLRPLTGVVTTLWVLKNRSYSQK